MSTSRLARLGRVTLLAAVVAAVAYCGWFRLSGGVWERVQTPSMGTAAPVGSLLWVRSVEPGELRAGDVVTFHAPDGVDRIYSHRVSAVHPDGTISTAGDLSGEDPWQSSPDAVVGRVDRVWPGVGRLVEAFPVLLIGGVLTWGAVILVRSRSRRRDRPEAALAVGLIGASVVLGVALVVYHPVIGAEQLGFDEVEAGAEATYVSTGLLPIALSAPGEDPVVLGPGEMGSVIVTRPTAGALTVALEPAIPPWFWWVLIGACFGPSLLTTARPRPEPPSFAVPA